MAVRVLLVPTLELARQVEAPAMTVKAEYGQTVVEGERYTAAYRPEDQVDEGRPSPCVDPCVPQIREGTILLPCFDLGGVGGVLRALPMFTGLFGGPFSSPDASRFWELAAFLDVHGPNRLADWCSAATGTAQLIATGDSPPWFAMEEWEKEAARDKDARRRLRAYRAWVQTRPQLSQNTVTDVTAEVREHGRVLALILEDRQKLVNATRVMGTPPQGYEEQDAAEAADALYREEAARARLARYETLMAEGDKLAVNETKPRPYYDSPLESMRVTWLGLSDTDGTDPELVRTAILKEIAVRGIRHDLPSLWERQADGERVVVDEFGHLIVDRNSE